LRKDIGDIINIVSDRVKYKTKIIEIKSDCVKCDILNRCNEENSNINLTIFQGLAKADKFEYIIQKCTELGAYEIVPVEMKRCVVKLNDKDKAKKIERWKKIAEVASKQSLRNDILKIDEVKSFDEMLDSLNDFDEVILAYEKEKQNTLKSVLTSLDKSIKNIAIIIGPEGGISDEEVDILIQKGVKTVTLGNRILRTETAPVAISAIIMYELEK